VSLRMTYQWVGCKNVRYVFESAVVVSVRPPYFALLGFFARDGTWMADICTSPLVGVEFGQGKTIALLV